MSDHQSRVEYRTVPGYPNYQVGTDGSVWSCNPNRSRYPTLETRGVWWMMRGRLLRIGKGYRMACLHCNDGSGGTFILVHRLVLLVFVGPCPDGMEACHGDGNSRNNALSNLRWDTPKANCADARRHGTLVQGERVGSAKLSEEQARFVLENRGKITQRQLAAMLGVTVGTIRAIHRRKAWQLLGGEKLPDQVTQVRGQVVGTAKLTEVEVRAIRAKYGLFGYKKLARMYSVSRWTIREIVQRRAWTWLVD